MHDPGFSVAARRNLLEVPYLFCLTPARPFCLCLGHLLGHGLLKCPFPCQASQPPLLGQRWGHVLSMHAIYRILSVLPQPRPALPYILLPATGYGTRTPLVSTNALFKLQYTVLTYLGSCPPRHGRQPAGGLALMLCTCCDSTQPGFFQHLLQPGSEEA